MATKEIIIKKGIKQFKTTSEIIDDLRKNNLSYRKQDMLFDIRKLKSIYNIKRKKLKTTGEIKQIRYLPKKIGDRRKKEKWFNEIFEPLRKKYNVNSKTANKILKGKLTTAEILEFQEMRKEYWDLYKRLF